MPSCLKNSMLGVRNIRYRGKEGRKEGAREVSGCVERSKIRRDRGRKREVLRMQPAGYQVEGDR